VSKSAGLSPGSGRELRSQSGRWTHRLGLHSAGGISFMRSRCLSIECCGREHGRYASVVR
jgi:hypothetical protein